MHRSNLIRMLLGLLFLLVLGLIWIWQQSFDARVNLWAGWITVTYGCGAGFWIWMRGLRLTRLIDDIPTSQIATAAQGYAEFFGQAARFEDRQAKSLIDGPVLWFRKEHAQRSDLRHVRAFPFNLFYVPTEVEESRTPFAIADGTGTACILPHGAEIICERKETRYGENTRVIEEQILPGDTLYVIGAFFNLHPAAGVRPGGLRADAAVGWRPGATPQVRREPRRQGRSEGMAGDARRGESPGNTGLFACRCNGTQAPGVQAQ